MKVLDLTLSLADGTAAGFGLPPAVVRLWQPAPQRGWWVTEIRLPSHIGTHVDAPRHWLTEGVGVEGLPLEVLVGPADVLHLEGRPEPGQITATDLAEAARAAAAPRWLLATGWDRMHGKPEYFSAYPSLAPEAAAWLVERGVRLLGVDMPSLSHGENAAVHRILLSAGVAIVEGLCGLTALAQHVGMLCVLPLPLQGADGTPVRAVVIEEE
ncbi:MAG: cyclase family protein [Armatimonadota bacterium]|nr:cyclase family protein [Armatimonadota bacterium]MDR7463172.1 cyclase family protein [Armatimonadota bacterium]MDR7468841.1 cyclase family protein [Armatimonadota bacterium]MDR7475417.1 cyclase family protein [Armatimonadota bacterium]MDR7540180.1 cyclase family protein [Armatimonadota bacterium]